jgi:hypothetical protein
MSVEEIVDTNFNSRGGLAIYGPGTDGNVIITGTVVMNRDMYYNNLTILGSAQLDTNGYRVFVKDTLNMADSSAVIGRLSDKTSAGSILGGASSGIKASDTLGGNGGLNPGENFFGEAEFYNFSQAIAGYKFDAVAGTLRFLMGGSGGAIGESGSAGQSGSFTAGQPGTSGSAGLPGTRPGFEYTVGASGGMGYPGSTGSPGSPGIGGSGSPGGLGGDGGAGGGVVIISARNIIGSGIIRADGESGSPGQNAVGFAGDGEPGAAGSPGSPGAPAPDFFSASYTYVSQPAYTYNLLYSYTVPQSGGFARTTYNSPTAVQYTYYSFAIQFLNAYNRPTFSSGNAFTVSGNARTTYNSPFRGFNPRRLGPASVRWRPSNAFIVPGNARTTFNPPTTAYNRPTFTAGTIYQYPETYTITSYSFYTQAGNARTSYNFLQPAYNVSGYNLEFQPDQFSIQPAEYFAGGAGGAGGQGGAGGLGFPGLPGSPGLNGYAGGGGVVLLVTESDIPDNIEVRAAAGEGEEGSPTSGTIIIIKNEAVDNAY